jgi:hypothetical protein
MSRRNVKPSTTTATTTETKSKKGKKNSHHVALAGAVDAGSVALGDDPDGSAAAGGRGCAAGSLGSGQGCVGAAGEEGGGHFGKGGVGGERGGERIFFFGEVVRRREEVDVEVLFSSTPTDRASASSAPTLSFSPSISSDRIESKDKNCLHSKRDERKEKLAFSLSFFFSSHQPLLLFSSYLLSPFKPPARTPATRHSCSTSAPSAEGHQGRHARDALYTSHSGSPRGS